MTAEYLNRSSLVARMKCYEKHTTEESGEHYAYSVALREIRNAPAADVAEVRHGRWIHHEDGVFTCSECGNAESNDSYYCRLCGAKMDGAAE